MHMEGRNAILRAKDIEVIGEHLPDSIRDRALAACQHFHPLPSQFCLHCRIERDQSNWPASMEDHVRRVGVHINIELGAWSRIARNAQSAAHNDHFTYGLGNAWFAA